MTPARIFQLACLLIGMTAWADDFSDALAAYENGKFSDAAQGFERVIAGGGTANAFYNLGNANFRLGNHGAAAIAYERALMLRPGFGEADANLKLVRERMRAQVFDPDWHERLMVAIHPRAVPWIALGVAWVGWLLSGVGIARKRSGSVACGLILAMAGSAMLAGEAWMGDRRQKVAVVVDPLAEARTQPADRAPVAKAMPAASRVSIISEHGDWTYCELPGGERAWIKAGAIERVIPLRRG